MGFSALGFAVGAAIAIAFEFGPGKTSDRTASMHDISYVLNWCEFVSNDYGAGGFRGDGVSDVLDDALGFVEQWIPSKEIPWFI